MLLNEQKKQALELYINQNHTQQQIAKALGNKSAKPATQFQPTSCQSFNSENPDSDNISATPTATTGNKSAIPATHQPATLNAPTGKKSAIPATHESATPTATTGNKSAIPATQLQPTSCKSYNPENPDSDKISANPTASTGNKPVNPATQFQPTFCQSFNAENPDSDKISANHTATTGNKSAISATQFQPTSCQSYNPENPDSDKNTTGKKPTKPINPDPTKPFTYQTKKYTITENPDGSIRYDNGVTPAVTVKKGEPVKLERREFFFR